MVGIIGSWVSIFDYLPLLLSCAANFSSVEEVVAAYKFFSDELVIFGPVNENNWMNYSLYQISQNEKMKLAVLSFFHERAGDGK